MFNKIMEYNISMTAHTICLLNTAVPIQGICFFNYLIFESCCDFDVIFCSVRSLRELTGCIKLSFS